MHRAEGDTVPHTEGGDTSAHKATDPRVKEISEADRIRELRDRLYSRGTTPQAVPRHALPQNAIHETIEKPTVAIPREVEAPTPPSSETVLTSANVPPQGQMPGTVQYERNTMASPRRKSFRKILAIVGVLFFVGAAAISSFFMFMGGNTISGENISLSINGPIAIGGGEELPFRVSIANQNAVPIQSATLIIEYPKGTHSATEGNKEISIERRQLDTIDAGEMLNVELKARVFGEENEEKEIKVSIDYRVAGSNAIFKKEATPLRFKVSTSPIVMTFDSVKSISSGQEVELQLSVQSNSPTPLSDILIKASYPEGFDFTESEPETVSGEDTWKIPTLKPAEKYVITVRGLVTGYEDDIRKFTAVAGVANASDRNTLASMLAQAQTEITIEQPFLDVDVVVNGSSAENVVISAEEMASIEIRFKNALDSALYDGRVVVELSGNALNEFEVKVDEGDYNSSRNTITWDSVDVDSLKEILPGKTSSVSFIINPSNDIGQAPELNLTVTVRGQRVSEDRVSQELVGTAERNIKIESVPEMTGRVLYNDGPFTNTGPVPPVAEKVTQYTYMLKVRSGTNDLTGAEVTAVMPQYVKWLDLVSEGDSVSYSATSRTLRWTIGDMDANTAEEVAIQVSFLPSLSQVGTTPTILEAQRFKATDRFTGTVVRSDHPALTTSLFDGSDEEYKDGRVRKD